MLGLTMQYLSLFIAGLRFVRSKLQLCYPAFHPSNQSHRKKTLCQVSKHPKPYPAAKPLWLVYYRLVNSANVIIKIPTFRLFSMQLRPHNITCCIGRKILVNLQVYILDIQPRGTIYQKPGQKQPQFDNLCRQGVPRWRKLPNDGIDRVSFNHTWYMDN